MFSMLKRREARIQKQFGERVCELRNQKGLSQESLALGAPPFAAFAKGWERTPPIFAGTCLGRLWIQCPVYLVRIAGDERLIGPCRLFRFRPSLLPIPQ